MIDTIFKKLGNIQKDKLLHFFYGTILSFFLIFYFEIVGMIIALIIPAVKELYYDKYLGKGNCEWADYFYTVAPTIEFSGISTTGVGTYIYNEIVTGSLSGTTARVRNFKIRDDISQLNPPVELQVSLNSGRFSAGEVVVGSISSARYVVDSYDDNSFNDPFDSNEEIETESDSLLDFTENNPFGDY